MTIDGKTWSRGTKSRLQFGVNTNHNLSNVIFGLLIARLLLQLYKAI